MSDSPIDDRPYDVFLSHNSKDKDAVRKLKQRLEADGLKVWFDERELRAGDELHKAIAEGLDQSRVCAVFIGSEGFGPWHDWEIGIAVNMHVNSPAFRLIPVILPRESKSKFLPSEVPLWLRGLLWVEFPKLNDDEPYQRLKDGILGRGSDFTPRAIRQIEEDTETNITPRGLRSFEEDDKHFFLRLVAGPRDHRGLPVSIAFWKNRLEQVDPDKTFRVGLLFGPSGCGKSSLVKAGLLPRLHQYVKTICLAATPDRTEQQLLTAVRKQVPELPSDLGLVESLAHLTSHPDVLKDFKLVIVLDQFEQWLHSNWIVADAPLIAALRQCDAAILQAVVMVRADFYVETHRLFEQLNGVTIQNDINAKLIDLFDRDHARNVLLEYGRAYGRFTDPQSLNSDEETFLAETLDQLQDGDLRLVAVQLALFADLMKNKPWTGAVLKKLGGATGVGRAFLEENFDAKTANATQRFHRNAAVAVLKELLPPRGAGIKGTSKTKSELMQAASYQNRPADFEGLLGVLLNDLKLISPVACEEDSPSTESPAVDPRYQLSHDYLVPSLRDWLTSKDRESWRGRARLLLEERTAEWQRDSENPRHFPSLMQWLQIQCGVPRRHRSPASRRLLRKTIRHYAVRTCITVAVILAPVVAWFGKEFCTFQAEFAPVDYGQQRQEIIITRRFDPRPTVWRFRQGTWVFKDEQDTATEDKITGRLELNLGWSPDWSPLVPFLGDSRLGLAELEWIGGPMHMPAKLYDTLDVISLVRAEPKKVIKALVASSNRLQRVNLSECLDQLGNSSPEVVDAMITSLMDQDREGILQTAKSLKAFGATTLLIKLSQRDPTVCNYLTDTVKNIAREFTTGANEANQKDRVLEFFGGGWEYGRAEVVGFLKLIGKCDIPVLCGLARDRDSFIRACTAEALGLLGGSDASTITTLIALLQDENRYVRAQAAESLGISGTSDVNAINALIAALKDEPLIRSRAATSLGNLRTKDAVVVESLIALLTDRDDNVSFCVAKSLGHLGKSVPDVTGILVTLLKDEDERVRSCAAQSLGNLGNGDSNVLEGLVALLEDKDRKVRLKAVKSLCQLGNSGSTVIKAVGALLNKHPDVELRSCAAESLGWLRNSNPDVILMLVTALEDEDRHVRSCAAKSLGELGTSDSNVLEGLVALLEDKDGRVRLKAVKSLCQLGKSDINDVNGALLSLLNDRDSYLRDDTASSMLELAKTHEEVIDVLAGIVKDANRKNRPDLTSSLVFLRKHDSHLIKMLLNSQDSLVRMAAAESVGRLTKLHFLTSR